MPLFHHLSFYLTIIFVQDDDSGDFTAFFAQFPEAVAQGRTKDEAATLLTQIFPVMMEEKHEEFVQEIYKNPGQHMTYEKQIINA